MTNVAIYYSMYGHVAKLANSLKAGVTSVPGVKASVYQVQKTLNDDLLKALHAPPKPDLPIATPDVLKNADGILGTGLLLSDFGRLLKTEAGDVFTADGVPGLAESLGTTDSEGRGDVWGLVFSPLASPTRTHAGGSLQ